MHSPSSPFPCFFGFPCFFPCVIFLVFGGHFCFISCKDFRGFASRKARNIAQGKKQGNRKNQGQGDQGRCAQLLPDAVCRTRLASRTHMPSNAQSHGAWRTRRVVEEELHATKARLLSQGDNSCLENPNHFRFERGKRPTPPRFQQ